MCRQIVRIFCFEITVENKGQLNGNGNFHLDDLWSMLNGSGCDQHFPVQSTICAFGWKLVFFWHSSTSQHQILVKTLKQVPTETGQKVWGNCLPCDLGGATGPGMIYFPTKWGAKEPQNIQNHRVVPKNAPDQFRLVCFTQNQLPIINTTLVFPYQQSSWFLVCFLKKQKPMDIFHGSLSKTNLPRVFCVSRGFFFKPHQPANPQAQSKFPSENAKAELLLCQNERWDQLARCHSRRV